MLVAERLRKNSHTVEPAHSSLSPLEVIMNRLLLFFPLLLCLCSCSHLKYASIQAEYARLQEASPRQVNLKHIIDTERFAVIGKTVDKSGRYFGRSLAIAAYSDKFKAHERVDTMYFSMAGTHFGLNLPEGVYTLLVFADVNNNSLFSQSEIVGQTSIALTYKTFPSKVATHVDIDLENPVYLEWVSTIPVPEIVEPKTSLFFPAGTIRSFSDPLFDENIATLGMYDPASFSVKAPTSFFALEEDFSYKIPIVFVHGIGATPRSFESIVKQLDRKRYKPWFYYYPSGGDLEQLAELFYNIFLSGKVASVKEMPMAIIAHSMGGLIVREALNLYSGDPEENRLSLFVSIATPFGGHPAAATGERHGLIVLPAWRDVNPTSSFLNSLYRNPLPKPVKHQLIYAYQNPDVLKLNENSDGVVPLSSQLHPAAQKQAHSQFGFNSSHAGILEDEELIVHLLGKIAELKNFFPEEHLQYCFQGGYELDANQQYSPLGAWFIQEYGKYAMAITKGILKPFYPYQERFIKVTRGEIEPETEIEQAWMKFLRESPDADI